ncbi:MAG: hypothetical protein KDA54_00385 [Phycisphaerales bacterium]|nr:hypothetical protein [Phycisphaerales bacterium]
MVLREAKKGPNAGSRFWGCPRFPQCLGPRQETKFSNKSSLEDQAAL